MHPTLSFKTEKHTVVDLILILNSSHDSHLSFIKIANSRAINRLQIYATGVSFASFLSALLLSLDSAGW